MTFVGLQMLSIGSLLILNDRTSSSAAGKLRCMSEDEMRNRADQFQSRYRDPPDAPEDLQDPRTCAQAARQMRGEPNHRSLSPWKYRRDRDDNRFPHEIAFAECLCGGCIINQQEELSYNSVLVFAPMMVLRKTQCQDENKYKVEKDVINVPVACTCVVPKYTK